MLLNSRFIVLLVQCLFLVTACGGSDGNTGSGPGEAAADSLVQDDSPDSGGIGDDINNAGQIAGADTVCGPVSHRVTYELLEVSQFSSIGGPGWYVPSAAPGIYGWDGENYCDLNASVSVQPITALVPFQERRPVIDGEVGLFDEWASAARATWSIDKTDTLLIRNLQVATVSDYQDKARAADWGAMHDGEHLYLFVLVRHEESLTGSVQVYLDSDSPVDDDSVMIFIDADNSKSGSYDGDNDYHSTVAYLDTTWSPEAGDNSASGLDITFRTDGWDETNRLVRYYEIMINLQSAGISVGRPFGFDIQINEDDNGGGRDALFAWHEASGSNEAESNTSVFGTVVLTGCSDNSSCGFDQSLTGD